MVGALKERLLTRIRRLGRPVEHVVVPCDGVAIVASTADLDEEQNLGRPHVSPTSGRWLPLDVAALFLDRVLSSTAVLGHVFWSEGWKADEEEPGDGIFTSGRPLITETACRILWSEGYEFDRSATDWGPDVADDILLGAQRRAQEFWSHPRCAACDTAITPDDKYWWQEGQPLCGPCDLACDLLDFLTRGRTEREIEGHLRIRRLTFRRHRVLIEEGLSRAGARKAPNGIWVPKSAQEEVA